MKIYEIPLGPDRPRRFPRKLKKRVIKEFGRDEYYQAKIGYRVVRKYRPHMKLTANGYEPMPSEPSQIGTLQLMFVIWDVFNGEREEYEKSIARNRVSRRR